MTSVRKSVSIAPETGEFGSGETAGTFYALPYGTFFSHTARRGAESIYATGSKMRQTAAYGQFAGQWSLNFVMDYAHINILEMIFDGHLARKLNRSVTVGGAEHVLYEHKFVKNNAGRVGHFVFCEKILNEIAGGDEGSDEVDLIKGAVASSITISRTMSGSQMHVEIQGVYCDQEVRLGGLESTDYVYPEGDLTQYSCMFMDGKENEDYVRDVDQHSISIDMEVGLIYNTCSPIATAYYEGKSKFAWNAQTYSNNPKKKFQLRSFSGGMDSDHMQPAAKQMGPMEEAYFVTYSDSVRDNLTYNGSLVAAIDGSEYMFEIKAIKSTVTSMTWQNGNGQKMMDVLSSVECNSIEITIRTDAAPNNAASLEAGATDFTEVPEGNWARAQPVVSTEGVYPTGWSPGEGTMLYNLKNQSIAAVSYSMPENDYFIATTWEKDNIKSGMLKVITEGETQTDLDELAVDGWMIVPGNTPGKDPAVTLQVLMDTPLSASGWTPYVSSNLTMANVSELYKTETEGDIQIKYSRPKIALSLVNGTTSVPAPADSADRKEYLFYIVKADLVKILESNVLKKSILYVTDHGILKIWHDKAEEAEE